jgi:hypothetical protein
MPRNQAHPTQHQTHPPTITLCPKSFANRCLRPVAPQPIKREQIVNDKALGDSQRLSTMLPAAAALFHKLFPLIISNKLTYPAGGEVYEPGKKAGMSAGSLLLSLVYDLHEDCKDDWTAGVTTAWRIGSYLSKQAAFDDDHLR